MKLESVDYNDLAKYYGDSIISNIALGRIYFVFKGRNAWHSTWIQNYFIEGSVFDILSDAKDYAENLRGQGTVCYIRELPCLVIKNNEIMMIVTDLESEKIFKGFDSRYNFWAPFFESNTPNISFTKFAMAFLRTSKFWLNEMRFDNKISFYFSKIKGARIISLNNNDTEILKNYQSKSIGSYRCLQWKKMNEIIYHGYIRELFNNLKNQAIDKDLNVEFVSTIVDRYKSSSSEYQDKIIEFKLDNKTSCLDEDYINPILLEIYLEK